MKLPANISNTSLPSTSFKAEFPVNSEKNTSSALGRLSVVRNTSSPTTERLDLYDRLVNQKNSAEEVVRLGGIILRNITQSNNPIHRVYSPSNHSGNWKSSFIQNLLLMPSRLFGINSSPPVLNNNTTTRIILPSPLEVKPDININGEIKDDVTSQAYNVTNNNDISSKSIHDSQISQHNNTDTEHILRVKRSPDLTLYDLTAENIESRIMKGIDVSLIDKMSILKIKESINQYNQLPVKNSQEGIRLLQLQSELLTSIKLKGIAIAVYKENIAPIIETIKVEYQSHKVKSENIIHAIWVAGAPPDNTATYIKSFLITYPEHTYKLWVDGSAFGAAKFGGILKGYALNHAINKLRADIPDDISELYLIIEKMQHHSGNLQSNTEMEELHAAYEKISSQAREQFNILFLDSVLKIQDAFFNFCLSKGMADINDNSRSDFLTEVLKRPQEEVAQFMATVEENKSKLNALISEVQQEFGAERISLQDVKQLKSLTEPQKKYFYLQEMLLRWNYPSASDHLRMYMLKEQGGMYVDTDILPAYSKDVLSAIMFNSGDNRFLEELTLRRLIAEGILSHLKGNEITDTDISSLEGRDRKAMLKIFESIKKIPHEKIFQQADLFLVRDSFKMFKRYQLWSTGWNVRGNNNFMLAHKDSKCVDVIISGQQREYYNLLIIRSNINKGKLFKTTDQLAELPDDAKVGGVPVKKYLADGLFSDYRQDSIIPSKISTLYVSGPNRLMDEMIKYYKTLGPLSGIFLNNGKQLSSEAFMGVYKKTSTGKYDWLNPESIGVNDITPDDESSWTGKKLEINRILFEDVQGDTLVKYPEISLTMIDKDKFLSLWDETSKSILQKVRPGLLDDLNSLSTDPEVDINKVLEIDQALADINKKVKNRIVRQAIHSLQLQLASYISTTSLPVDNHLHLFADFYKNISVDLLYSLKLFLNNDPEIRVTVWYNSYSESMVFIRTILAIQERNQAFGKLIKDAKATYSLEQIEAIKSYRDLKNKQSVFKLSVSEEERLFDTSLLLQEDKDIHLKVTEIENSISKGERITIIIEQHSDKWGKLLTSKEDRSFYNFVKNDLPDSRNLYDKIREESVSQTQAKRKLLQKEIQETFQERIQLQDINEIVHPGDLLHKLQRSGYVFSDINLLSRYSLASQHFSGVFSEEIVYPAPSKKLIDTIKKHMNSDQSVSDILPFIFYFLSNEDKAHIGGHHIPPENLVETIELIKTELLEHPIEYPFIRLSEQSTSVLGAKFSSNNGHYDESVFLSGDGRMNTAMHTMNQYLTLLFEIHTDTLDGVISEDSILRKYGKVGIAYLVTDEKMAGFMHKQTVTPYLSLTEIHQELTGYKTFAEISMLLQRGLYSETIDILRKPLFHGHPPVDLMSTSSLTHAYDFSGLGILDNPSFPVPQTLHAIVEQAKYNLLSWDDFYHSHVSLWDTAVRQHQGYGTDYHPQSLMPGKQGRCLGLSLIYLEAGGVTDRYRRVQENLMEASALFQTKHREGLPLSPHDDSFLHKVETLIQSAHLKGNHNLARSGLLTLPLTDPDRLAVTLSQHKVSSLLITTESHSLALQGMGSGWRVTDPNFGHTSFVTLSQALTFIRDTVGIPEFRPLYGSGTALVHFSPNRHVWLKLQLPPSQTAILSRISHQTTAEQLAALPETVSVGGVSVTKAFLHEIGATVNKVRVSASTNFDNPNLPIKLNGNILQHYLNSHVVTNTQAQEVRAVLDAVGIQTGTQKVKPDQVFQTPPIEIPFHVRLQQQKQHIKLMLLDVVLRLDMQLKKKGLSLGSNVDRIDRFLFPDDSPDTVQMRVTDNTGRHHTVSIDVPELGVTFREGLATLSEGVEAMNLDAVMSVIGLVQYGRLMASGEEIGAQGHAGAMMDVKNLLDKALGVILRMTGNKIYNPGISGARLEGLIAARLEILATRMGGTAGRYLSGVAKVMKVPLIDMGINIWAMYTSVRAYTEAVTYTERMVAAVDISFSVVTTALSLASMAYPPLAMAIVPVTFFAQDTRNFVMHNAKIQERRDQWLEAERFLDNGARNVLNTIPEEGILDLSNNQVLGRVVLDLRTNPPRLSGSATFNSGRDYGSRPGRTDRQVMAERAYNWSCTNNADAHVPAIFGEHRTVCNAVEITADQMAQGYANRLWPEKIPTIPEGQYRTVMLGYGETLRANTEVTRMLNGDFREIARESGENKSPEPLLSVVAQSSRVIGGDLPLTVVIPVADKMLLGSHLHMIDRYKNYRFMLEGGKGGITVVVGGIGQYDITGRPGARNVLSYRQMPRDFTLELDLSNGATQKIRFHHPSGFFNGVVMTLRQHGINTVIGTASGYDRITGSDEDNTFYLSAGGGAVYSGGGNNVYVLPDELEALSHIYLSPSSQSHHIHFNGNSTRFGKPEIHRTSTREFLFLPLSGKGEKGLLLEGYDTARLSNFTDRVIISTEDGLELRWHGEPAELKIARVNVPIWKKQHTGVSMADPDTVLAALSSLFSMRDPCTLEWPEYQEVMSTQMRSYLLSTPKQQFSLPASPAVSVVGTSGSRYLINPAGQHPVILLLKGDKEAPEEVDLSKVLTRQPVPEVRLSFQKEACRITIISPDSDVTQEIILRNSAPASGHIHHSPTLIRLSSSEEKSLALLHRMVPYGGGEIQLHAVNVPVADRVVELGLYGDVFAYLPDASHTGGDQVLCLENSSGVKRMFQGQVSAGVLKGIQGITTGYADVADIKKLGIPPHSRVYLVFEGSGPVLIQGTVTTAPLLLQGEDSGVLAAPIWQALTEIIVLPGEHTPSVQLLDFEAWRYDYTTQDLMHEVMYHHDIVRIEKKDLILTLFRWQTEPEMKVQRLVLKDFFIQDMGMTIPSTPESLINPAYRSGFSLMLGRDRINIQHMLSLYSGIQKTPTGLLEQRKNGKYILHFNSENQKVLTLRLTPETARMHMKLMTMVVGPKMTFYINANGDLLLTRVRHINQATIIILEAYRDNWWRYHMSLDASLSVSQYEKDVITFSPAGVQITTCSSSGQKEFYSYPVPESNKLYSHNPSAPFSLENTEQVHKFGDLQQRIVNSSVVQTQDLQVEKMATVSGSWKITPDMLRYFPGYYHTQVSDWPVGWLKTDERVSTSRRGGVDIYLTTTHSSVFEQKGDGYQVYCRIDNIEGAQPSGNQPGNTRCTLLSGIDFIVTGVDETQRHKKIILITLSPAKYSYYNIPGRVIFGEFVELLQFS